MALLCGGAFAVLLHKRFTFAGAVGEFRAAALANTLGVVNGWRSPASAACEGGERQEQTKVRGQDKGLVPPGCSALR